MSSSCPLCGRRRGRRACPALGQQICAICCGTKRLVEVDCPEDCTYLASAKSHPPAAVRRQSERDFGFLLPILQGLTDRQHELLLLIQGFLRTERPDAPGCVDDDVVHASRALAETFETASRGIIYEHAAGLVSAERLSSDIKAFIEARRGEGLQCRDADLAIVMRRIERAATDARSSLPGDPTAYLGLLKRVLRDPGAAGPADPASPATETDKGGSRIIVPGR